VRFERSVSVGNAQRSACWSWL